MPSIHLSENFGDLLDARFARIYDKEYAERINESMIPMLFGMKTSTRAYEMMSGIGGLGDMQDFDGTIAYDAFSQLYDSTVTFPEKALGIKAERKLVDDEMFGILDGRPWQLAVSVARTREKAGAAVFANAFTDASGADGVALCSASHPYSPDDATTQSNTGTSALSATSVEATRRLGYTSIYNDRGQLFEANYDTLVIPVGLEETAYELINSKGKVDTANNNANFHSGRYKLAVWPRLTDSNNWFFIDSKLAKQFLLFWDRVKPEFAYDRDFDTLVAKWSVYARYNTQFTGWQFVYGMNVTG
jgi:hypothetical protein